jgi:MoaA/NifB/PqqE/SkfB family radical SAM enzyme
MSDKIFGANRSDFINYGSHIAISLTNRCPLRCAHCVTDSGPDKDKHQDLLSHHLDHLIDSLPGMHGRIHCISLTGGESGLLPHVTARIVAAAHHEDIAVGIISSAFWAKTLTKAEEFLEKAGSFDAMTISTDVYHLEFVPLSYIRNAFDAATRKGIPTYVRVTTQQTPTLVEANLMEEVRRDYGKWFHHQHLIPWGRAADLAIDWAIDPLVKNVPTVPCPSSGPHIMENGDVIPCCNALTALPANHPLKLGNIGSDSLTEIWKRAEQNALLTYLRLFGTFSLVEALQQNGFHITNSDVAPCHVCASIFKDQAMSDFLRYWIARPENLLMIAGQLNVLHGANFDYSNFVNTAIQSSSQYPVQV